MNFQCLCVVFETESGHSAQYILPSNSLPLLHLTLLGGLARDEADEFRDAFLNAFLGIFCNLGCGRNRSFHDTRHVCNLRI
jgi:hypothetical protein